MISLKYGVEGRRGMNSHKRRISGYIKDELYRWVEKKIEDGTFASLSHAVEKGLIDLRQSMRYDYEP